MNVWWMIIDAIVSRLSLNHDWSRSATLKLIPGHQLIHEHCQRNSTSCINLLDLSDPRSSSAAVRPFSPLPFQDFVVLKQRICRVYPYNKKMRHGCLRVEILVKKYVVSCDAQFRWHGLWTKYINEECINASINGHIIVSAVTRHHLFWLCRASFRDDESGPLLYWLWFCVILLHKRWAQRLFSNLMEEILVVYS